jgi:uncharacterized protein YbaA (DUF1428 family)
MDAVAGAAREVCMARYVDGFVMPLKKKKVDAYRRVAKLAARVWRDHGALEYFECLADDTNAIGGTIPFPRLARCKPGETVVFSWIVYASKAARDRINAKVMKDPRMTGIDPKTLPFDWKRMSSGGFAVLVEG